MRTRTNKAVFITEETHAKLTRLIGKKMAKGSNKGRRITFDEVINELLEKE